MKAVLTRVNSAEVSVAEEIVGAISAPDTGGILALIGVHREDDADDAALMARKIAELRILRDEKSVQEIGAPVLVVSQFTLQGRTKKGRRPSWSDAAPGELAYPLIAQVITELKNRGIPVSQGQFGAMMQVSSVNDGPFTVLVDTKN
ncbi:D-aminoacyl-tRNA deacylase [Corynebacterium caspium]|uniref:D-aminoacyl-tRNA deacylase n=1 Tax=Corynebacterium caspium TaxID=234828 RepID=UPI00035D52EF|nr:D-aminoacyl-tRNA deacylase [Corynebacterium caspium]WKD59141.1 D-tyrosyl-tRNA(Tyr) deacylase [Corynebacterium caspium DSM 44850]